MATALPCVVSGIGGNTDLIADHQTGRLVPSADSNAWATVLIELLNNPDQARRLGIAARQRVEREFSLRVMIDRYLELYRCLIQHCGTN
jgi:glycosyltransferase involved in cell wall biosynthesis